MIGRAFLTQKAMAGTGELWLYATLPYPILEAAFHERWL